ncbi:phage regulatory CII family protein [Asticcacaulis sp.]|uniref:phage regulatory CII family protein n=1 Tax=Asticcacaulis sp. TaxID=1872648 RepID=UPI003F7B7A0E
MTKQNCPVSLHGVTERAFDQIGGFDEVLTVLAARKRGALYDMIDPDRDPTKAAKLTYADARALTRAGATALAEDLARLCGMQLVPLGGDGAPVPVELMTRTSALMTETGEAVSTVAAAIADGRLEGREIKDIRTQVQDVIEAGYRLLTDLEKGG